MTPSLVPVVWEEMEWSERLECLRRPPPSEGIKERVAEIIASVGEHGDHAIRGWTHTLDGVDAHWFGVDPQTIDASDSQVGEEFKAAVRGAAANIEKFHRAQLPANDKTTKVETTPGVVCTFERRPLGNVGIYVPGGSAPLFSTVLMLGIPAAVAGCKRVILCSPPQKSGGIDPHILYTAKAVGIRDIYAVGGAQAIALMALGTASVERVDKIFGPGNAYVTEAKQQIAQHPGGPSIDMPAGPSELMIVADSTASPEFVAADLLSQAEHGPDSQVILVLLNAADKGGSINESLGRQLGGLARRDLAAKAMAHARIILAGTRATAVEIANEYAPEHLSLQIENAEDILPDIETAGSIFVGHLASESFGDYAAGTNHVLPTGGFARSYSGVNTSSFLRTFTTQTVSPEGLKGLGPHVITMAETEGLDAHAMSVKVRLGGSAKS